MLDALKNLVKHTSYQSIKNIDNTRFDSNVLKEIANRRKTDTLFHTILSINLGFTTGAGYFLSSTDDDMGDKSKERIEEWIKLNEFDDIIAQISEDLLSSGNCWIRIIQDPLEIMVLPLGDVNPIEYDDMGKVSKWNYTINGQYIEVNSNELIHATWRKDATGFGKGIGSAAASRGTGYYSNSGVLVQKQNYFETREGILDLSLKAYAASLPRFVATTSNGNEESVNALTEGLTSLEPLSSLAVSDDIDIKELSLDSKSKIDAMIQVLQQEDVTALASPIQQLWSLRGHSWAAARESVRVMMPFLHSFELAVERTLNNILNQVIQHEFIERPVTISFEQSERIEISDVKEIMDIVNSNEQLRSEVTADTIKELLNKAGVEI